MIGECAATNSTSPLHSAIAARNAATRPIAIRPDPLLSAGLTIYPHGPDQPHAARRYSAVLRVDDPRRSPLVLVARGSCTRRVRLPVSYTHLRAHETPEHLVCRLLLEKKKKKKTTVS